MIRANYTDKSLIVDILTKSFDKNKSVNYAVKQDKKKALRIKWLMEYTFENCWQFGEIYMTNDKKGVALIILPHTKKTSLKTIIRDLTLVKRSIGISRVFRVIKLKSTLKKHYPKSLIYISFIGVLPGYQQKGIGGTLLQNVISLSKKRGLPIYLETSTQENLAFYNKYNFELYHKIETVYTIYMFRMQVA